MRQQLKMENKKLDSSIFQIPIINNVILYDEIDSTNIKAKELGNGCCVDGTLIIADKQFEGKGRLGRNFSSPSGTGIYMSLLLKPKIDITIISQITIIAAIAVAKALDTIPEISPKIKWPNDIVVNGKKIVGILTEMSCDTISQHESYSLNNTENSHTDKTECYTNIKYVIVGIGINVNNEIFPELISGTASSLYLECGRKLDRSEIITKVLHCFNELYLDFLNNKSLSFTVDDYNSMLASYNKEVYIIPYDKTVAKDNPYLINTDNLIPHLCLGINSHGDLICKHQNGQIVTVNSGEVSVRGIDGYI